ncbi:MAG: hypothetical protein LBQ00_08045 [Syntrophobacterales bacterium]|jgi:TPP-dependent indolepyruvate ferredoxin oxidoreductase alpha subunit|nr:hypothetical protein [Syntrophobacterales bacterium]
MYEFVVKLLLDEGARLIHTTNRMLGKTLKSLEGDYPFMHSEVSLDGKTAFELALTGSCTAKRGACIFSTEGLYDALDPVMSSAYIGITGGFLVLCMREIEEEATPVGLFSKLPVLVAEGAEELARAVRFGYAISEKYEIPVVIQSAIHPGESIRGVGGPDRKTGTRSHEIREANFIKNPDRWAATPKFRYDLHRQLNEKIEKIREEFEAYEGNVITKKGGTGIITYTRSAAEFFDDDASMLCLSTVFPLPLKLIEAFLADMDEVFIAEGSYPIIELQISDRSKIIRGPAFGAKTKTKPEEIMYGFKVIRDTLGAASSINMAHGVKKKEPGIKILAVTFEDYFFQAGMPALVNTMYNGSAYVLLILAATRENEMQRIMEACGCRVFFHIDNPAEIERFKDSNEMTVLFYKGIV